MAQDFIQLRGAEISEIVSGMLLVPDESVRQLALPFAERFSADGRWLGTRDMRARLHLWGHWSVEGDLLCVTIEKASWSRLPELPHHQCRTLSRNAGTGQLLTTDLFESPHHHKGDLIFTATPFAEDPPGAPA
jgi:hypothetical protein